MMASRSGGPGPEVCILPHEVPRENIAGRGRAHPDRKSTRLNSSHLGISYAVFCLKKKKEKNLTQHTKQREKKGIRKTRYRNPTKVTITRQEKQRESRATTTYQTDDQRQTPTSETR